VPDDDWQLEFPPLEPGAGTSTLLPDPVDPDPWGWPIERPRPRPPGSKPPIEGPLPPLPGERPPTFLDKLAQWWRSTSLAFKIVLGIIVVGVIIWLIYEWYQSENPDDEEPELQVAPIAIRFNWDETSAKDALNIRRNYRSEVEVPEWTLGKTSPEESPAAYAIDAVDPVVKIKVQLILVPPQDAVVNVRALGGGVLGDATRDEPVTFSGGSTVPESIEFELKNHRIGADGVLLEDIEWTWQWQLLGESSWRDIGATLHRIYIVLSTPTKAWLQSPYPDKANPWAEVLEYSCTWAKGAKNVDDAARLITEKVNSPVAGIRYDMRSGKCRYTNKAVFRCTRFLGRLKRGSNTPLVNCTDCATIVSTFANALGCDLDQQEMRDQSADLKDFRLNEIIAIGQAGFGYPHWGDWFGYHEVAWQGGGESQPVWDACLKTNENGPDDPKVPVLPVRSIFLSPYRPQLVRPSDVALCQPDATSKFRREAK